MSSYQLDDTPVATGGQGAVYFGTDPKGRAIAVKVAAEGDAADQALQRELEIVRHMNDAGVQGVVPCLAELKVRGRRAMVMPRYPEHMGDWLKRTILDPTPHSLRELFTYHQQLASVLGEVHRVYYDGGTVVHRDVKPENIFLDGRGGLFLGDFGGAMAVEQLKAVELAMFGTPMWAPLDQLLPGRAMPDTTWDTYATCVLLYAAITGARPAYQADPRELLTGAGQALWDAARAAVEAEGSARREAQRRFAVMRKGTRAEDLVDLTGRAALVSGDREALTEGLERLCGLAGIEGKAERALGRGVWNLLVRGLSPLSHPSPPNRFRDASELAESIEDLLSIVEAPGSAQTGAFQADELPATPDTTDLAELLGGKSFDDDDDPLDPPSRRTNLSAGAPILAVAFMGVGAIGLAVAGWFAWPYAMMAFNANRTLPDVVDVPEGTVQLDAGSVAVRAFRLDTTEVSVADYRACAEASACPVIGFQVPNDRPATGLGIEEADAVCAHRGGRVPSEAQWMHAHGPDTFPWGEDDPTCDRAIALGCGNRLGPVGSGRQGPSAHGAIDMAGNAWEWVRGVEGPVLVGGGMSSASNELGRVARKTVPDGGKPGLAGVRCAYPASAPDPG